MISVLVTSTVPDRLNTNSAIRGFAARGFEKIGSDVLVYCAPFDSAENIVATHKIDLVVAIGGVAIGSVSLHGLKRLCLLRNTKLALWLHDDPFEFDYAYRAEEVADQIFTNDSWSSWHYKIKNVIHLPLAGCKDSHYREIRGASSRDIDLLFCGVGYPNRVEFFRKIKLALKGYNCVVLGDGWPDDLNFAVNRRMTRDELADLTSRSLLTLNITRDHSIANKKFELPPSTPGPRTFETALSGCMQLYVVHGLEVTDYFDPISEIALVDNADDIAQALRYFGKNKSDAIEIAKNSQQRALRDHCYEHRAAVILSTMQSHFSSGS